MDITTRNFFRLLRAGAFQQEEQIEPISAWKWKRIYQLSLMHSVSALVFDGIMRCRNQFYLQLPEGLLDTWKKSTEDIENANRRVNEVLVNIYNIYSRLQLRPMLLKGQVLGVNYDNPLHRKSGDIDIFFPFQTQGRKADQWAHENASEFNEQEKYVLSYRWKDIKIENHHRMLRLTNQLNNHKLQNIIDKELRENPPYFISINGNQVETIPPTLSLLLIQLRIIHYIINDGLSLKQIVDLGMFLRTVGDKVDYVTLQNWIDKLGCRKMAQLTGALLVKLLGFTEDEIPFIQPGQDTSIEKIMQELFLLRNSHDTDWYFQQGKDIFVHASNSSAMFWQARRSARYFRYYPQETFTNFFSSFAHSLSHIEE